MVGRTGFKGDLIYSIGVSGFIYPIVGHWVWGPDGWLATQSVPFNDFAGSTGCTPSAAPSPSSVPSPSDRALAASSSATAAA